MTRFSMAAALLAAAAASGALAQTSPPSGRELLLKTTSEFEWKPSTNLPPGAEYQLVREDPVTRGIEAVVRFPSGYAVPAHAHDVDETIVVLKGKLALTAGAAAERVLKPFDYAAIPAGLRHEMRVKGFGACWMLVTTSGPYNVRR